MPQPQLAYGVPPTLGRRKVVQDDVPPGRGGRRAPRGPSLGRRRRRAGRTAPRRGALAPVPVDDTHVRVLGEARRPHGAIPSSDRHEGHARREGPPGSAPSRPRSRCRSPRPARGRAVPRGRGGAGRPPGCAAFQTRAARPARAALSTSGGTAFLHYARCPSRSGSSRTSTPAGWARSGASTTRHGSKTPSAGAAQTGPDGCRARSLPHRARRRRRPEHLLHTRVRASRRRPFRDRRARRLAAPVRVRVPQSRRSRA